MKEQITVEEVRKKAKRGLVQVVFSRGVVMSFLLLLQLVLFITTVNYFSAYDTPIYIAMTCLSVIVVIRIINEKGNPAFKLAWVVPVMGLPIVGACFYLYCKTQQVPKRMKNKLQELWIEIRPYMREDMLTREELRLSNPANANLAYFLSNRLGYPVHRNTKISYFSIGEEKFEALLCELKKAKKFIFMEYFIVEESFMWDEILEVLEAKVQEGVEVRFMYDGMCSIELMPYNYPKILKAKGIKCKVFSPVIPVLSTHQNNRDHRKITVIDGKIGFMGGINLGDEYINRKERFGHWKDTAIMLEGEAVQSLTMMFLQMWNINERLKEKFDKYTSEKSDTVKPELGFVLPYGDSPYDDENVGEEVYLHILQHAKKYVHIMTPYLILDNEMLTNLTHAAKSGIEVIIIMPDIPDKWYAFALAQTYYEELIEAGVQIYQYTPGFVHAKMFVSDNDTAVVGTINLDYRSLYLNFECGTFIYKNRVVGAIEKDFQDTLHVSRKITLMDVKNRSVKTKVAGNIFRMIAPLL